MAVETIRDLAFSVALKVNMTGLNKANQHVDKLKSAIMKMNAQATQIDKVGKSFDRLGEKSIDKTVLQVKALKEEIKQLKEEAVFKIKNTPLPRQAGVGNSRRNRSGVKRPRVLNTNLVTDRLEMADQKNVLNRILPISLLQSGYRSILVMQKKQIDNMNLTNAKESERVKIFQKSVELEKKINNYERDSLKIIKQTAVGMIALYSSWKLVGHANEIANNSIDLYKNRIDGVTRQETFFANSLKYREGLMGKDTGSKNLQGYIDSSRESLDLTNKNIESLSKTGVVSKSVFRAMTGQLASFQIDPTTWFTGSKGKQNLSRLGDLVSSIYGANASQGDAINTANMIGKANSMQLFGQLQRWGIVATDAQKKIIKTGTASERLSMLMKILDQNVGGFNERMAKTPWGAYNRSVHKYNEELGKMGLYTAESKTQQMDLKRAMLPFWEGIYRVAHAPINLIISGLKGINNAIGGVDPKTKRIAGSITMLTLAGMGFGLMINGLKLAFSLFIPIAKGLSIALGGVDIPILVVVGLFVLLGLAVEDVWTYMKGGKSVTGNLIGWIGNVEKAWNNATTSVDKFKVILKSMYKIGRLTPAGLVYKGAKSFYDEHIATKPDGNNTFGMVGDRGIQKDIGAGKNITVLQDIGKGMEIHIHTKGSVDSTNKEDMEELRKIVKKELGSAISEEMSKEGQFRTSVGYGAI